MIVQSQDIPGSACDLSIFSTVITSSFLRSALVSLPCSGCGSRRGNHQLRHPLCRPVQPGVDPSVNHRNKRSFRGHGHGRSQVILQCQCALPSEIPRIIPRTSSICNVSCNVIGFALDLHWMVYVLVRTRLPYTLSGA